MMISDRPLSTLFLGALVVTFASGCGEIDAEEPSVLAGSDLRSQAPAIPPTCLDVFRAVASGSDGSHDADGSSAQTVPAFLSKITPGSSTRIVAYAQTCKLRLATDARTQGPRLGADGRSLETEGSACVVDAEVDGEAKRIVAWSLFKEECGSIVRPGSGSTTYCERVSAPDAIVGPRESELTKKTESEDSWRAVYATLTDEAPSGAPATLLIEDRTSVLPADFDFDCSKP